MTDPGIEPGFELYQTEPRLELFPQCFDSILDSPALVNKNLKRKGNYAEEFTSREVADIRFLSTCFPRIVRYAVKGAAVLRIALYTG